jgi:glutathione synthase/RimK-type ligase-like ATP-grasp enzyme
MRVAIATCAEMPGEFVDDQRLLDELRALGAETAYEAWDADGVDWATFDAVVIRSTWDYARRHDEFVAWAEAVGERLFNPPAVVRWNSDKRYLGDLAAAGLPVVETAFAAAGDPPPAVDREVVVKPNVSAGGRDTGRFAAGRAPEAHALVEQIQASGRVAMVQPFQHSVDERGETACVFFDGEFSHALRKRAVLEPDEVAPVRDDFIGAAEAMYRSDLVDPAEASAAELELAEAILAEIRTRFDTELLYARVDMLHDAGGAPVLLELEAIEPNLYFDQVPEAAARLAAVIASLCA